MRLWGLASGQDFFAWYDNEEEGQAALDKILRDEPEADKYIWLCAFDEKGTPCD